MKKFYAIISIFILANALIAVAEDEVTFNFGLSFGGAYNMHSPDYEAVFDSNTGDIIPIDKSGDGLGFYLGGVVNAPLSDYFTISGRLGYYDLSGAYSKTTEPIGVAALTKHEVDASLAYFEVSPMLKIYNLLPAERFYLLAGIELGVPISPTYRYEGTSEDGSTVESTVKTDADVPDAMSRIAAAIGAGYTFNFSDNVYLSPEISYRHPITQVTSSDIFDSWNVAQIRLGVNITFALSPTEDHSMARFDAGISEYRYYDKYGNVYPLEYVKTEEVKYSELFPLVPYIFCDVDSPYPSQSEQILAAQREPGVFSIASLPPNAMEINRHTLDIVGERMSKEKDSKIKITGTIDGKMEKKISLSEERVKFARDYLVVNYGVEPSRIETEAVKAPENPSSRRNADGVAENRRIELSDGDLLSPIIIEADRQILADPNRIEFIPFAATTDSIVFWEFEISQSGNMLRRYTGSGRPDTIRWAIAPNELSNSNDPIGIVFTVQNSDGAKITKNGSVDVEFFSIERKKVEELKEETISAFSLILFEFDKDELKPEHMKIIDERIVPAIKPNSKVEIIGYTDRIGSEDYNRQLAERRAEAVKEYLEKRLVGVDMEIDGVGEYGNLYDNDFAIGRQLSRAVQVFVRTPKE